MASPNVVTGRYQENYPESYKKDVTLEDDFGQSTALANSESLMQRGAERSAAFAQSGIRISALTQAQLDEEFEYIKWRLFGDTAGLEMYEEESEDFDEVFRDCSDEIAALWLEKYEDRFDREPPVGLMEYSYPMMGIKPEDRMRFQQVLDSEYKRLSSECRARDEATFYSVPKGIFRITTVQGEQS